MKIVNNRIESAGAGINVTTYEGTANSDDVSIKDNHIIVTGSSEAGISITTSTYNLNNIRVHDNDIKTSSTVGIEVDGGTGTIDSLSIKDNDIRASKAIYIYNGGSSATMTNVVVNENDCHGGIIDLDGINGVDVKSPVARNGFFRVGILVRLRGGGFRPQTFPVKKQAVLSGNEP